MLEIDIPFPKWSSCFTHPLTIWEFQVYILTIWCCHPIILAILCANPYMHTCLITFCILLESMIFKYGKMYITTIFKCTFTLRLCRHYHHPSELFHLPQLKLCTHSTPPYICPSDWLISLTSSSFIRVVYIRISFFKVEHCMDCYVWFIPSSLSEHLGCFTYGCYE